MNPAGRHPPSACVAAADEYAERIRVRGLVQGVGFRPTVWRLARQRRLRGWVANDGGGLCMHVCGAAVAIDAFVLALEAEAPLLARVDAIEREVAEHPPAQADFVIVDRAPADRHAARPTGMHAGMHIDTHIDTHIDMHTDVAPDAATCADCLREILDPAARRHRYPFTNCTHCGPRLAIIETMPYARVGTTMCGFPMCADCAREYADPGDRRFHAQPIACPACGPRAWLERADGSLVSNAEHAAVDAVQAAARLLGQGRIVAIKGLGGFQLACDAGNADAVARLRLSKRRECKPFALMAPDLAAVRAWCHVGEQEAALLDSAAAPIVVLDALRPAPAPAPVAAGVAPGLATLGVMLPNTPLHHLLLRELGRAIVLTSGNLSDEPQAINNAEARTRLAGIASHFLMHDRDIACRVDDSLLRVVAGAPRMLRRARGYAPAPIRLPAGFERAPSVLALGGELKNSFCLLRSHAGHGEAILSHHIGDLENAPTHGDYTAALAQYLKLFGHRPQRLVIDLHPQYLSSQWGAAQAHALGLPLDAVQHHHAHIAACMAENGITIDHPAVLGVALDGLGLGDDGALWGGEFLLADYRHSVRLASLQPVALPGGAQAMHEPWRNAYAHLVAALGWDRLATEYAALDIVRFLRDKPIALLDGMLAGGLNTPTASSCGRLFDAVAATVGICREQARYEGQAAIELETQVDRGALERVDDGDAYPFDINRAAPGALLRIDARPMWRALVADLARAAALPLIAGRFHKGLAMVIVRTVQRLRQETRFEAVALSGGVMQNRVLCEQLVRRLGDCGLRVLTHRAVPANDGGLALGQAVVAAARSLASPRPH